jgi:acyl carrier protein
MDALHVLVGLSQELDVEIPVKDYGRLTTKADIVHYLQARVPEKQRGK